MPTTRIAVVGDLHSGHVAGLTPPAYQWRDGTGDATRNRIAQAQAEAWEWYAAQVREIGRVHALLVMGDCIDGRGERSQGVELITADRETQAAMATEALKLWRARHRVMVYGTSYHTGQGEDWEAQIARELGARIGSHEWVTVSGVTLDLKHHLGSSSIPHGRHTAAARDHLWNTLWARDGAQPDAQLFLRGHVHYYQQVGGWESGRQWAAATCPALQLARTRYGARRCSGIVHFGLLLIEIRENGTFSVEPRIAALAHNRAEALRL